MLFFLENVFLYVEVWMEAIDSRRLQEAPEVAEDAQEPQSTELQGKGAVAVMP